MVSSISTQQDQFRLLPSIDELLRSEGMQAVMAREGRAATVAAARRLLDELRARIARGKMDQAQVMAAVEESVPADVLTASLYTRFRSRQDHTFAEKVLSAMRKGFGGHVEPGSKK